MVNNPEKWFEGVNDLLRGLGIPYDVLKRAEDYVENKFEFKESEKILDGWTMDEKQKLLEISKNLMAVAPSPEIYIDCKRKIAESIIADIMEIYPDLHSAIVFGDPLGDIDIGVVLEKPDMRTPDEAAYRIKMRNLKMKAPLVDINAMHHFRTTSGSELTEKIFVEHIDGYFNDNIYPFDEPSTSHLKETFTNAYILFGDMKEYGAFMALYNNTLVPAVLEKRKHFGKIRNESKLIYEKIIEVLKNYVSLDNAESTESSQ